MERFLHQVKETIFDKSIEVIEACIAKGFLIQNGITDVKNRTLTEILNRCQGNENSIQLFRTAVPPLSIKNIERLFELLIQNTERKTTGAYYTPEFIVNYIVNKTVKGKNNVCDPACGSGAFLISVAEKIARINNFEIINVIENNIYGVDLSEHAVRQAKLLLTLLALQNGEDKEDIKFNIIQADSLTDNWSNIFPEVMRKGGFDSVIGNPPYIKLQMIADSKRKEILKRWESARKGNFNTYIAFVELGLSLINSDGNVGYIIPNNYFTSLVGQAIRELLQKGKYIQEIVDFGDSLIFEDARTYTCITILDKEPKGKFLYYKMENKPSESTLENIEFDKIKFESLNPSKWRILPEPAFSNVMKIETIGKLLGNMAKIRVGIATLKDSLYFIDGNFKQGKYFIKEWGNKHFLIEEETTRPIVKIGMIGSEEQIKNNTLRIIFPYKKLNGKYTIIIEEEIRNRYPKCYNYLLAVKKDLGERDKGKGRSKYPTWYAYGRGQGLNNSGPKLLTPTFSDKPNFLLNDAKDSLYCNGYGIYYDGNLRILQKILNSFVMDYYIEATSVSIENGYWCYQKNFIERFSIPNFTREEMNFLERAENKETIDDFLIEKYSLLNPLLIKISEPR